MRVVNINYSVEKSTHGDASSWVGKLLDRAYGESQRNKRIKILINPYGGKGSAQKYFTRDIEPILAAARCELDVERTNYRGHAIDIAEKLDISAWDTVACCSGDGLPHEVFNGFSKRPDAAKALRDVAVFQFPCGTGNAMCLNLCGTMSPSMAAVCAVKGLRMPLDLVSITQADRRTLSFLSQSVGIIAESDLGTEHLRWMGSQRFTVGFLIRLFRKTIYPADIAVGVILDDKPAIEETFRQQFDNPSLYRRPSADLDEQAGLPELQFGTVNEELPQHWNLVPRDRLGNFYSGNMAYMSADTNFFTKALPTDGQLDLVNVDGDIPRMEAIKMLFAVEHGKLFEMDLVSYRKVSGYRIIPRQKGKGYISIDGERYPFEPFQAEVHSTLR